LISARRRSHCNHRPAMLHFTNLAINSRRSRDTVRATDPRRGSRRNSLRNTLCDLRDGCAAASECTLDGGP
jgi:hypothetical protein